MFLKCVTCPKVGISCAPRFEELTGAEILELCKKRKNYLHMTNAKLAELSGIPKGTVDRIFAGEHFDFKWETMRPIIKVLFIGLFDAVSCPDLQDPQADAYAKETIERLKEENDRLRSESRENAVFFKEQLKIANDTAKGRKTALIVLSIALAILLLFIITALIVDKTTPGVGFFWMDQVEETYKNISTSILTKRFG